MTCYNLLRQQPRTFVPDFRLLTTNEQLCIWYYGSTNPLTKKQEKPSYCNPNCEGLDELCGWYMKKE